MREIALLHHQYALATEYGAKVVALSGGYGAGKTWGLCAWAAHRTLANNGAATLVVEPSYPMVRDVFVPTMSRFLDDNEIPWDYLKSEHTFTLGPMGWPVMCRSGDNPRSLEGLTIGCGALDEFELQDESVATIVISKLRDTRAHIRQLALIGTPESFGWGYRWLEEEPADGTRLIRARTSDNTTLGADYEKAVRARMSDEQAAEKLDGKRMMKGGRVYTRFDRSVHCVRGSIDSPGRIEICADFNVETMAWGICKVTEDRAHVIEEMIGKHTDTRAQGLRMRQRLAELLGVTEHQVMDMKIPVICDASGDARHTSASMSDVGQLIHLGFRPQFPAKNPYVEDRIAAVQLALGMRRFFIDPVKAPTFAKCFEQQPYDSSGRPDKDPKKGLDHAVDAGGYLVFFHFPAWKPRANQPAGSLRSIGP